MLKNINFYCVTYFYLFPSSFLPPSYLLPTTSLTSYSLLSFLSTSSQPLHLTR